MKTKILFLLSIIVLGTTTTLQAQKLKKFGSSIEKKIGPKTIKVPYTDVVSYLGYAAPGNEDEVKDGKKFYYIYVWVPAVAPELGVRMMSPVGKAKVKKAIKSEAYTKNAKSADYFDTYITLERSDIISTANISQDAVDGANWTILERNDDSGEMPKQPSGSSYNSLLRYKSDVNDPLKALTVGLYRIGFTTYKTGEVKGTFLAEVAAPVKLPGVVMAKTIKDLKAGLSK
ncbi:Surface lipoprotein of Spirochaetales order [Aquimarina amphilecti]|uniref:Surface lipoprotein of Spirochaetales order n=1 Tax=Aquimarina amphilecti TaxID=1038014 RepID=A0A1H7W7K3_AQUAM|nr:Lipl32 family lipoprotein [Aquimarina amphilecti]SEM17314.1 Surface lipoprotein of Spirochaetales order [Aquimarina amphilecti]